MLGVRWMAWRLKRWWSLLVVGEVSVLVWVGREVVCALAVVSRASFAPYLVSAARRTLLQCEGQSKGEQRRICSATLSCAILPCLLTQSQIKFNDACGEQVINAL